MSTRDLTVDAARWHLLGLLFERPRPEWRAELRSLATMIDHPDLERAVELAATAGEGDYLATLGTGGSVSPREVAYRPMADPGKVLADLAARYEAFGYRPRSEDPPDHLAIEAGFVGYLTLKEAYAEASGNRARAELCREARAAFLADHLGTLARGLARRLPDALLPHAAIAAGELTRRCPPGGGDEHLPVVGSAASADDEALGCDGCSENRDR